MGAEGWALPATQLTELSLSFKGLRSVSGGGADAGLGAAGAASAPGPPGPYPSCAFAPSLQAPRPSQASQYPLGQLTHVAGLNFQSDHTQPSSVHSLTMSLLMFCPLARPGPHLGLTTALTGTLSSGPYHTPICWLCWLSRPWTLGALVKAPLRTTPWSLPAPRAASRGQLPSLRLPICGQ